MTHVARRLILAIAVLALLTIPLTAQDVASFEKRVTVKKLPNGLTLIVCNRPEAPVFSFFTLVDAGSANDPQGESGLAHMFEHMAFKGTDKIGTTNYPAEKIALEKVEQAYAAYNAERHKRVGRDEQKVEQLHKQWQDAMDAAQKFVIEGAFDRIVEENGGVNLNAFTSEDETAYFYSFPVNRLQLWAYLESQRYAHPVLREFYKERDVVTEERRMRTDSSPVGRLIEQFNAQAFIAHPYHRPGLGWMSDLDSFSATDAQRFHNTYYVPSNMYIAVVGDVSGPQVMPMLEKYFGELPTRPKPPGIITVEPPQNSERQVVLQDPSQPFFLEGYHRPDLRDPDDAVYNVISDLLSDGRTSRLYRALVRDQKIAAAAAGFNGLPGDKYPNLFALYAVPTPGHTPKELQDAVRSELARLKTQDVSAEELQMVKTRAKATLIRSLNDNEGLAQNLATMQARFGDWRELFRQVDRIDKVTPADIKRVANKTFTDNNRTVGIILTQSASGAPKPGQTPTEGEQK